MKKPELLAPAGDLEKLKMAIRYGADAVYLGGEQFGLRAQAGNFSLEQMAEGVKYAHSKGVKVYVTVNIFAHNRHLDGLPEYIHSLQDIQVDAVLVSDLGVYQIVRDTAPNLPIHISTQANTTNWATVKLWKQMGAERVVLARELSFEEIQEIKEKVEIEIETFVHGAMCISYSGRCLLSSLMTGRSANLGACAQPCRWKYSLVEETRPGQYFPIEEDNYGSYVFNSRDLCMIHHIPELVQAGIDSFKIEGRMKSIHYVATVVGAYRKAIDAYFADPEGYHFDETLMDEIRKVSHREYTTGFFFGREDFQGENTQTSSYRRDYEFIGIVKEYMSDKKMAVIEQRNKFSVGEAVEFTGPDTPLFVQEVSSMTNERGQAIEFAPHAQQIVIIPVRNPVKPLDMIRREKSETEEC